MTRAQEQVSGGSAGGGADDRPRLEWVEERVFSDEATGITVRVMKLPLRFPKYQLHVCWRDETGRVFPRLEAGATVDRSTGEVRLLSREPIISRLLVLAESFVYERVKEQEAAYRARPDNRQPGDSRPEAHRVSQKELDKRKRRQDNLARRRQEDRARKSSGGGNKKQS